MLSRIPGMASDTNADVSSHSFDAAHLMEQSHLQLRQFDPRPNIIDLGWGHPDPDLLPVDGISRASVRVLSRYGSDALGYGASTGPGPLIEWICDRLQETDARSPDPDSVAVSAGNSHALDLVTAMLTEAGDVALVEAPTYHLAIRILRDHGVRVEAVPTDGNGLQVEALERAVSSVRRRGGRVRMIYTIPTFHNPLGVSLGTDRRRALVEFSEAEGIVIVEDDAYRELSYDEPAPPSLWSIARPEPSCASARSPNRSLRDFAADSSRPYRALTTRIARWAFLASGGCVSHFSSLVVAEFGITGEYAQHVEYLRRAYTERRDALLAALSQHLDGRATWSRPAGATSFGSLIRMREIRRPFFRWRWLRAPAICRATPSSLGLAAAIVRSVWRSVVTLRRSWAKRFGDLRAPSMDEAIRCRSHRWHYQLEVQPWF